MEEQGTFNPKVARSIRAAPTKRCGKCKKKKPLSEFAKKGNGHTSYCFPCQRANSKKWYRENKSTHIINVRLRKRQHKEDLRQYVLEYLKSHPCIECGEDDIVVLQFHHRRRSRKLYEISKIIGWGLALDVLVNEIKKCDVLCANCHTRKEARRNGAWKTIAERSD